MAQAGKFADKALQLLRTYPRVALNNLKDMPGAYKKVKFKRRKFFSDMIQIFLQFPVRPVHIFKRNYIEKHNIFNTLNYYADYFLLYPAFCEL